MEEKTFEQSLTRLEDIVRILERGESTLDSALSLFDEGMSLAKGCSVQLNEAEAKISLFLNSGTGEPVEKPFKAEDIHD